MALSTEEVGRNVLDFVMSDQQEPSMGATYCMLDCELFATNTVEGESMFYDGQGREPAGFSFLPGGCPAFCKLLDSLSVNTLAVIRLRWRRVVRALFFTAICSLLASVG